jgi:DNA polymerase-3 subunit alpha
MTIQYGTAAILAKVLMSSRLWYFPDEMKDLDMSLFATDILQSGKISDKQYKVTNWRKMIDVLCAKVPEDEFPSYMLGKLQYDVLGYVDRKDPTLDKRYVVVTALDTTYSPKFKAYCIATGQSIEMKVHKSRNPKDKTVKTSFRDEPFVNGDILYMRKCNKKPKVTKVGDDWIESPTEIVWWLDDYSKVDL